MSIEFNPEPTMQEFLDLLPGSLGDDREIINTLDRLCLRFAQDGRTHEKQVLVRQLESLRVAPSRGEWQSGYNAALTDVKNGVNRRG